MEPDPNSAATSRAVSLPEPVTDQGGPILWVPSVEKARGLGVGENVPVGTRGGDRSAAASAVSHDGLGAGTEERPPSPVSDFLTQRGAGVVLAGPSGKALTEGKAPSGQPVVIRAEGQGCTGVPPGGSQRPCLGAAWGPDLGQSSNSPRGPPAVDSARGEAVGWSAGDGAAEQAGGGEGAHRRTRTHADTRRHMRAHAHNSQVRGGPGFGCCFVNLHTRVFFPTDF